MALDPKTAQNLLALACLRATDPEAYEQAAAAAPELRDRIAAPAPALATVNVISVDDETGELAVGLDAEAPEQHAAAEAAVRELVPQIPLRFYAARVVRDSCPSKTQDCRPLVGGIRINSDSTLCVAVSLNNGSTATVVSSHAMGEGTGQTVGQPSTSSSYGKVTVNPSLSNRASDSALAAVTNRRVAVSVNSIWKSGNSSFSVTAYDTKDSLQVGDTVSMQGMKTDSLQSGKVVKKGVVVRDRRGQLTAQVLADYTAQGGDSGAPIFQTTSGSKVTVVGIHAGRLVSDDGTVAFFSTWKATASELGL